MLLSPASSVLQKLMQSCSEPVKTTVQAAVVPKKAGGVPVQEQQQYWQAPFTQLPPRWQALPQLPQLLTSVCRFTHVPLQLVKPDGQTATQVPFWQVCCDEQAFPQVPQLLFVVRSVQLPLQQP
jgi:hypothetical protein